jgi:hypothetical protein
MLTFIEDVPQLMVMSFVFEHLNLVGEDVFVWQIVVCSALFSVSAQMFTFCRLLYAYGKLKYCINDKHCNARDRNDN